MTKVVRAFFVPEIQKCLGIKFSSLRTMTSGRGQFSMEFKSYMPCPSSVADALYENTGEKVKEEKEAAKK